jgi:hypothetical protein
MPLKYVDRGTSGTQLDIVSGKRTLGRLWKAVTSVTSGGHVHWTWMWQAGPGAGPQQHPRYSKHRGRGWRGLRSNGEHGRRTLACRRRGKPRSRGEAGLV